MKVTGIIAEYNPFHKGHLYQIKQIREKLRPDYIVIAMSGNFLQRGAPAFMDKYARAQMALRQGADLVFELPVCFATASAEVFAGGGVALFHTTGVTDTLCFGAESDSLAGLVSLSELLAQEPPFYKEALSRYLKEGHSFPVARAKALPEYADLLSTPNNILALEYLKALLRTGSSMTPFLVPRKGHGYHDTRISGNLASASAIRKHIFQDDSLKAVSAAIPKAAFSLMEAYEKEAAFLSEDDFSLSLHQRLIGETPLTLAGYADFTPAIANRVIHARKDFHSWSSFCEKCNTREITYARLSRLMAHLLLNIKKEHYESCSNLYTLPYLRILGFQDSAGPLLSHLKKMAEAPLITSPAKADKSLAPIGQAMLKDDIYAADLYRCVLTSKTGICYPNEYQRKFPVVHNDMKVSI